MLRDFRISELRTLLNSVIPSILRKNGGFYGGFYKESKELHCLTRCVALKFENLLTSSRYFSELKDLSFCPNIIRDLSNQLSFFFTAHSFYEYVQSNQSNTRDHKNVCHKSKLFSSMLFSFSPCLCFLSTK